MSLEINTFPPVRLAYMRYTGPYGHPDIAMHWQRFGAWCEQQGLMQPRRKMYGISLDNPMLTPPDKCRYDLAIEVDSKFKLSEPDGSGVGLQQYDGGRYACTAFTGTALQIGPAWMAVFGQTLPMSGLQREEKPVMEVYLEDFELDPKTFAFSCLLCVPVKA